MVVAQAYTNGVVTADVLVAQPRAEHVHISHRIFGPKQRTVSHHIHGPHVCPQAAIVTVYSVVFYKLEAPVLQETVEDLLLEWGCKDNLAAVHRRCVTHFDDWEGLTQEDLDAYEERVLMNAEKK